MLHVWKRFIYSSDYGLYTVYPKKYAHGFVVLCFVVVMQSFIMNSHEVFIHIHQGCFAGTGAIVRLPQYQWSKPGGYGKISQCITTTKHNKAKTVCIFLGIYCKWPWYNHIIASMPLKSSNHSRTKQRVNYSISQEIRTRSLLCCGLLWLYIDWFSHIHHAYFTGTVAI